MNISIEGIVVPTSPMHVASLLASEKTRFDPDNRRPFVGNTGLPLTVTAQKGLIISAQERPDYVPYFPSNDLRGRLRRQAAAHIFESLHAVGEKVTIDTYDGMNAGNFRGCPDTVDTTLEEVTEFNEHFFMGVFGGGPRVLPSRLVTHDMNPIYSGTLTSGFVAQRFAGYAFQGVPWDMLDYIGCTRRDDTSKFTSLTMLDYIDDAFNAVQDRQDELSVARNKRKAEKASVKKANEAADAKGPKKRTTLKKDDLANMFAFQCIRAGLPLSLNVGFSSPPNFAQVGLILEALLMEFNKNALGGLTRLGAGSFHGFAELIVDGQNLGNVLEAVDVNDDHDMRSFRLTSVADKYIEAKDNALAGTSTEDLERFFLYGAPAKSSSQSPTPEAA